MRKAESCDVSSTCSPCPGCSFGLLLIFGETGELIEQPWLSKNMKLLVMSALEKLHNTRLISFLVSLPDLSRCLIRSAFSGYVLWKNLKTCCCHFNVACAENAHQLSQLLWGWSNVSQFLCELMDSIALFECILCGLWFWVEIAGFYYGWMMTIL